MNIDLYCTWNSLSLLTILKSLFPSVLDTEYGSKDEERDEEDEDEVTRERVGSREEKGVTSFCVCMLLAREGR